jgi:hypothetical protein
MKISEDEFDFEIAKMLNQLENLHVYSFEEASKAYVENCNTLEVVTTVNQSLLRLEFAIPNYIVDLEENSKLIEQLENQDKLSQAFANAVNNAYQLNEDEKLAKEFQGFQNITNFTSQNDIVAERIQVMKGLGVEATTDLISLISDMQNEEFTIFLGSVLDGNTFI